MYCDLDIKEIAVPTEAPFYSILLKMHIFRSADASEFFCLSESAGLQMIVDLSARVDVSTVGTVAVMTRGKFSL